MKGTRDRKITTVSTRLLLNSSYLGQISVVIGIRQIQRVRLVVGQNPRKHGILIKVTETSTCQYKSQW